MLVPSPSASFVKAMYLQDDERQVGKTDPIALPWRSSDCPTQPDS